MTPRKTAGQGKIKENAMTDKQGVTASGTKGGGRELTAFLAACFRFRRLRIWSDDDRARRGMEDVFKRAETLLNSPGIRLKASERHQVITDLHGVFQDSCFREDAGLRERVNRLEKDLPDIAPEELYFQKIRDYWAMDSGGTGAGLDFSDDAEELARSFSIRPRSSKRGRFDIKTFAIRFLLPLGFLAFLFFGIC